MAGKSSNAAGADAPYEPMELDESHILESLHIGSPALVGPANVQVLNSKGDKSEAENGNNGWGCLAEPRISVPVPERLLEVSSSSGSSATARKFSDSYDASAEISESSSSASALDTFGGYNPTTPVEPENLEINGSSTPETWYSGCDKCTSLWNERVSPDRLHPETPQTTMTTSTNEEVISLQNYCWTRSVAVIDGICAVFDLDMTQLTTKSISKVDPKLAVDLWRQQLQSRIGNVDYTGKQSWKCKPFCRTTTLKQFATYQGKGTSYLDPQEDQDGGDVGELPASAPFVSMIRGRKYIEFVPTVDLSDVKWRTQLEQLEKLPEFLRYFGFQNMLSHIGYTVIGMNAPQMSMMVPGSRVPGCQENLNFCAVNLNCGPGDCEWFAVPYEHWRSVAFLCASRNVKYIQESWWPDLEDLKTAGIPVYHFIQKSGQTVWINCGVVYWYQALGVCNNVSWNVGPITSFQFELSMERYRWNKIENIRSYVPMIQLTWNMAKSFLTPHHELFVWIKGTLQESLKDCVNVLDLVKSENVPMSYEKKEENGASRYCVDCQAELFYIMFRDKPDTKEKKAQVYCLKCAQMKKGGTLEDFVAVYEYELEELKAVYERFILVPQESL